MTIQGHARIFLLKLVASRGIPWQTLIAAEPQQSLHWLALLLLQLPVTERTQVFADFSVNDLITDAEQSSQQRLRPEVKDVSNGNMLFGKMQTPS